MAKVASLNKQKAVLTELSNRLKSELLRAGIYTPQPGPAGNPRLVNSAISVQEAGLGGRPVIGKLDQLEQLQYKLAKKGIQQSLAQNPTRNNKENEPQPISYTSKTVRKKEAMPAAVDLSSNSDSTMKPKTKSSVLQPRFTKTKTYQAPAPATKPKPSNVPWIKAKKTDASTNAKTSGNSVERVEDTEARKSRAEVENVTQSVPSGLLDSMDLGSSIQEVWNFLDEQPSVASSNPS